MFGCSDPTPPETVGSVEIVSGSDGQSAVVGRPVTNPPAVLVKSTQGRPLEGVVVTFAVASGGGTVSPATATTNASGIAAVNAWTLGTTAGENRLTATPAAGT